MSQLKLTIKQRNLPHWEIDGAVYFITFNTWKRLEITPAARQIVLDACKFFDNQRYCIFVMVIMPDHAHLLMQPLPKSERENWSLSSIMHSIKSYPSFITLGRGKVVEVRFHTNRYITNKLIRLLAKVLGRMAQVGKRGE
jgi:REP element-mobilizing transposase RayT